STALLALPVTGCLVTFIWEPPDLRPGVGRARDLGAPCWARLPHAWGGEPQRFGDVVVDLVVLERELFPRALLLVLLEAGAFELVQDEVADRLVDRKSTRLNSSHVKISYPVFCSKKNTQLAEKSKH